MSATKSLTAEQNRRIVALLHRLKDDLGGQLKLAKALGVSQPLLSEVMSANGKKGVGGKVLAGLVRVAIAELAIAMGAKLPRAVADGQPDPDTMAMARQAAEGLASMKIADRDRAWLAMRDIKLERPSVEGFAQEAFRLLSTEEPSSPELPLGDGQSRPPPAGVVRTRYRKSRAAGTR